MRCLGNGTGFVRQVLWGAAVIGLTTSLRGAVADVSWFAMMLRFAPGDGRDADGHTVTLVLDTQPPSTPVSGLLTLDASNGAAWRAFGFYLITSPQVPVPRFDDVRVDLR